MDKYLNERYQKSLNRFFKTIRPDFSPNDKALTGLFFIVDNGLHCEISKIPFAGLQGYCVNFYLKDDDKHAWYAGDGSYNDAISKAFHKIPTDVLNQTI